MTFNKFWVLLVFVLLYFFVKIILCAELGNLSQDLKKKKRRRAEAHSMTIQTSEKNLFVKIVNGF